MDAISKRFLNAVKEDFNQGSACVAPISWSLYTTLYLEGEKFQALLINFTSVKSCMGKQRNKETKN